MDKHKTLNNVPRSLFSYLSNDLKLDIFDLVQSCGDQGNTRLVCQEWSQLMRPRMWRSFRTSLRGSFATDPNSLSKEQCACFHDIRILTVDWRDADHTTRFSALMHYLRKDQLLEFTSTKENSLDIVQLLSLLSCQSRLRSFRARLYSSNTEEQISLSEQIYLFTSNLHSLRTLRIYIGDRSSERDYSRDLIHIKAMPLLSCLEVCGWPQTWTDHDKQILFTSLFGDPSNLKHASRTLTELVLTDMDLSGAEKIEPTIFNTATLLSLKLERCVNFSPFLQKIATIFQQTVAQLKVLWVRSKKGNTTADDDGIKDAVKNLLCSFEGLEELELDFLLSILIDWKIALRAHRTLKKLLISSTMMKMERLGGHKENLRPILDQCPNLQAFAYAPIRPHFLDTIGCQLPCSLPSTIYLGLDEVATALTIRKLRLLYSPGFREYEVNRYDKPWIEKFDRIAHRLATLILTYLYSKGSGITFLSLSPITQWRPPCGYSNLYYYPHYFYGLQVVNTNGQHIVTAVPLRDYKAEYLEAASVL